MSGINFEFYPLNHQFLGNFKFYNLSSTLPTQEAGRCSAKTLRIETGMRFQMPLWTSCLGRDCLLLELGQRRKHSGLASLGQHGRCRNAAGGECAARRAWSLFGPERKADNSLSNTRNTID
jgi:hypothetical protein